jgi:UDP-N-acetyl-2-amino-2-deoxyglucuronate dehydrogenase
MKQGIHPDYKQATVRCACGNRFETRSTRDDIQVEDAAHAILELPSGGHGSLQASTTNPSGRTRIELESEAATLVTEGAELLTSRLPQPVGDLMAEMSYQTESVEVTWETTVAMDPETSSDEIFDQCVVACHRDFLASITEGRQPLNNGPEATRSVELANAIYLSAVTGEEVELPLDTEAYAKTFEGLRTGKLQLP